MKVYTESLSEFFEVIRQDHSLTL